MPNKYIKEVYLDGHNLNRILCVQQIRKNYYTSGQYTSGVILSYYDDNTWLTYNIEFSDT